MYCQKVSPQKTPQVIGKLLDLDCNEDFIRNLLNSVGIACPVEELVEQVPRDYFIIGHHRQAKANTGALFYPHHHLRPVN